MNVLVVTNMFPTTAEPWNGCFVKDQVHDLKTLGIAVKVLAFDGRYSRAQYAKAASEVRSLVQEHDFDLIHAHYGLTGAVAMAQRRTPIVTTFHGSDTGYVSWQRYVSWVVARRTTAIFVSQCGALALGLPDATVIPTGVDTTLFKVLDRREARHRLGWPESGRYVLLPGARANRVKGRELFDATVNEARKESGLQLSRVSLEGFSREEVVLVMNAVDATLMTSESEGSPVAVKESLACMTPVVSVPVGDVPEAIAGLPGCAVASREPAGLARALLEALSVDRPPALRQAATRYSRSLVATRVRSVYEGTLAGRAKS